MAETAEQKPLVPLGERPNEEIIILEELVEEIDPHQHHATKINVHVDINSNSSGNSNVNVKSLLGLTLGTLSLSIHSLNPSCEPSFSLAGAAVDQINVPGTPFSASISCPRLDPEHTFVFLNGEEHLDFTLTTLSPSSSDDEDGHAASSGSQIGFPYGLNATSLVGIIAADIDGYPFMSSFPLHFDDDDTTADLTPSSPDETLTPVQTLIHDAHRSPLSTPEKVPAPAVSAVSPELLASCGAKRPDFPMLRPECQDPAPKQCDFYSSCVEASLPCGTHSPSAYALPFGLKICRKFEHNLRLFSPRGNDFVWGTMTCLQQALVPAASDCDGATCQGLHDAAYASHPHCYVANGFCSLACTDYLVEFMTVGMDLFTVDTAKAIFQIAAGCLHNVTQIIEEGSCMGDGLKGIIRSVLRIIGEEMGGHGRHGSHHHDEL